MLLYVVWHPHVAVVPQYCLLDIFDLEVGEVAGAVLPSTADVVEVLHAVTVLRAGDDQAPFAVTAPDDALEVVVVGPLAGAGAAVGDQDLLYPVEQVLVDDGRVAACDFGSLVVDKAEVVAVAQHVADFVDRHRAFGPHWGGPGA
ncbi:hypothetical protein [Frankia sp. KB5]|uniref:hypothetical protein n=1 Tax=Frankia sp. KB5 TaxID=683318 RepID=UPI001F52C87C|nr:hypothetical protein [Frankia sp. KB5]